MKKLMFISFVAVLFCSCSNTIDSAKFSELYKLETSYHKLDTLQPKNIFNDSNRELLDRIDNKIKITDEEIKTVILKLKKEKENKFIAGFTKLRNSEKKAYKQKIEEIKRFSEIRNEKRQEALTFLKENK